MLFFLLGKIAFNGKEEATTPDKKVDDTGKLDPVTNKISDSDD